MPHALRLRPAQPEAVLATARVATRPTPPAAPRGLRAWWARNVVAMDPTPEPSRLDQLDDLGHELATVRVLDLSGSARAPFDGLVRRVA